MEEERTEINKSRIESDTKQIGILRSGNSAAIIDTVNELRVNGTINLLPEILEILLVSEEKKVIDACSNLINDLKTNEATDILITAIKAKRFLPVKDILVSACWQNGLDYHKEYKLFAEILIKDNYSVAIEAFTVIENLLGDLNDNQLLKLIELLSNALPKLEVEKKNLVEEMLELIKSY